MKPYLARVTSNCSIGIPSAEEMEVIVATDSRQHRKTYTAQKFNEWAEVLSGRGFHTGWRVARDQGRLLAHIWFAIKDGVVTVLNVQVCAYGVTQIQVCAMLIDAEVIFSGLGASTICYLTSATTGTPYDLAFEACGYLLSTDREHWPKSALVLPLGGNGEPAAVRWRHIESTIADDRLTKAEALCLDQTSNTVRSLPSALPSDS